MQTRKRAAGTTLVRIGKRLFVKHYGMKHRGDSIVTLDEQLEY